MGFYSRITTLIFLALTGGKLVAQSEPARFELGANATPFVKLFMDFGDGEEADLISPYILTFEHWPGRIGYRVGLGFNNSYDREIPNEDNGFTKVEASSIRSDFRVGLVLRKQISTRWTLKYGIDGLLGSAGNSTRTSVPDLFGNVVTTTIADRSVSFGIEPFVFMQVDLSPRISLATEVVVPFLYTRTKFIEENSAFPDFNDESRTEGYQFDLLPPTSLFFILKF